MAITFKSFSQVVGFVADSRYPVMLRARHGVGKSAVVYAYGKHIGIPVVERRASQMTEGDLLGLPKLDEGKTEWIPPAWLKTACDEPVLLFVDEIDRATTEVRQGFFELCDSRKIAGWHLHPDTLIFAAVNGGDHGAQYQVGEMDPAELDRWTVFDLEPSVEDWLTWAKESVHETIVDFIRHNHKHLEHNEDFEPNKVYPSRRSWDRLSQAVTKADLVKEGETSSQLFNLATSFVGFEAAIAYQDFVKQISKVVTPEDILVKGKINLTKDFDINAHAALVEKMADQGVWAKKLPAKQMKNLGKYFITLPSEVAMKLFKDFSSDAQNKEVMNNVIDFHELPEVQERLIDILAKSEDEKKEESK